MDANTDRETAVCFAKLAEAAGLYDDMVAAMKCVVLKGGALTVEERNLLASAYKNKIASRRASRRIMLSIEKMEESKGNKVNVERVKKQIQKVETEMADICIGAKSILDEHVIPSCTSQEDYVFYYTMLGDYLRYHAELKTGDERKKLATESLTIYEKATKIAEQELLGSDPIRLGLALNVAVLHYEILALPERACAIGKAAIEEALSDKHWKASTKLMDLLRENIIMWTTFASYDEGLIAEENVATNKDGGEGSEENAADNDRGEGVEKNVAANINGGQGAKENAANINVGQGAEENVAANINGEVKVQSEVAG